MKKVYLALAVLVIVVYTSIAYRIIEKKWVSFRKAENYYQNYKYKKAIDNYLIALQHGIKLSLVVRGLGNSSSILGDYDYVVEFLKKQIYEDEKNSDIIIAIGDFFIQIDQFDKVEGIYKNYLKYYPDSYKVKIALADYYSYDKNYKESVKFYDKILKTIPENYKEKSKLKLYYARILIFAEEYEKAFDVYQELIKDNGKTHEYQIELVNLFLIRKKYLKAVNEVSKINKKYLSDSSDIFLANSLAYLGKNKKAEKIYKKHLKKYPNDQAVIENLKNNKKDSEQLLQNIMQTKLIFSSNEKDLLAFARFYQRNRSYSIAENAFIELIKIHKKVLYVTELANTYVYDRKLDDAIKAYNQALELDKNSIPLKKQLAFALSWNNEDLKALKLLNELYKDNKNDQSVGLEIARIYMRENRFIDAKSLLNKLIADFPNNLNICIENANFEAIIGHPKKSKDMFLCILEKTNYRDNIYLQFANSLSASGNFYVAERIYKELLQRNKKNEEVKFKLAFLYASTQRYEKAQEIYDQFIFNSVQVERALSQLSELKIITKEYDKALFYSKKVYEKKDNDISKLQLGRIYFLNKDYQKAIDILASITSADETICLIYLARSYEKLGDFNNAKKYFQKAIDLNKCDAEAAFYLLEIDSSICNYQNLLESTQQTKELQTLAKLYSEKGFYNIAIEFLNKALKIDPDCFFASLDLARLYAIYKNFDASYEILNRLDNDFINNYKIILTKARAFSWNKDFEKSILTYEELRSLNALDPVIIRELARIYSWDQKPYLSYEIYDIALKDSVDNDLKNEIILTAINNQKLLANIFCNQNTIFCTYEEILKKIKNNYYNLNKNEKNKIERILLNLSSKYNVQKSIFLEQQSKWEFYMQNYLRSKFYMDHLRALHPYNLEALFDLAQDQSILGLCSKSIKTYEEILEIDPMHNIVNIAYARNKILFNPYIQMKDYYYEEKGRGDLDRMISNKTNLNFGFPIKCDQVITASAIRWTDEPTYEQNSRIFDVNNLMDIVYPSYGYAFEYNGVLSPFIKTKANFSQKFYLKNFRKTNLGFVHLMFNLNGYLNLDASYDVENQLDNIFSLRQKIQTKTPSILATAIIKKRLEFEGYYKHYKYSDNNYINHARIDLIYKTTFFPKIFRLGVWTEYRQSQKLSEYIYSGNDLINIINPYWTPNKYYAFRFFAWWYHNFSNPLINSNQIHYYELKLFSGTDTEKNPTITFEGSWYYGIGNHFTFNIKGLLHRSILWNSQSIWAEIKYQF
ncbi:MAG: hypothetical protein A2888_00330 [Chlamydiae bacterium RIFCSPLOWO2_01_FULL_28_7]|nr:MAG: hypothetical protein A2888_00330 [Chlamydiae bacterium RIFCSPLOWO2_01_FULL_28_7]